jgi:hypothetical protein
MDIGISSSQVEFEAGTIVHYLISHLYHHSRSLLLQIFPNYGHKDGLDVLDLLDQKFLSKTDCKFEAVGKLGMSLADDFYLLLILLEPLDCLVIGIQNQGNSGGIEDHHRILNGE